MPTHKSISSTPRHPLCPYCHYNMVAVVDALTPRTVRCPECGEDIEPGEFAYKRRPGEWTELIGLRNAAISIAVRCAIVTALWTTLLIGMDQALTLLGYPGSPSLRIMVIPMSICAYIVAWLMSHKLDEHAGFHSWLITWLSVIVLFAGLQGGAALADTIAPLAYLDGRWSIMVGMAATLWLIYSHYADE